MLPRVSHWSTLRTALAITISVSLLVCTLVSSASVGAQNQERQTGKPRREKPEGELPDLQEVQHESQMEREPQAPIPSTARSPKLPLKPWDGRRVGDPEPWIKKDQEPERPQRAHASRRVKNTTAPCA
jgi:hypothetical protein